MGMYDEFQFDKEYPQLPEHFPTDGWQTKDVERTLSFFRVLPDGRILRKGNRSTNDEEVFYFSHTISGRFGLYTDSQELTLVVREGFVVKVIAGLSDTTGADFNWQPFEIPEDKQR